jgi:hypothetical protein
MNVDELSAYAADHTIAECAVHFGVTYSHMSRKLRAMGFHPRRTYRRKTPHMETPRVVKVIGEMVREPNKCMAAIARDQKCSREFVSSARAIAVQEKILKKN